jgi:hypothetical protein
MRVDCPELVDLAQWAAASAEDPRRVHTQDCPRCGARLASLYLFCDPQPLPVGADLTDAEARLARSLRRELAVPRAGILRFAGRRSLAVAALLVVMAGLYAGSDLLRPAPTIVLRETPFTTLILRLGAVDWQREGTLRVAWSSVPGAEVYAVLLVDAGGDELKRLDGTAACELVVTPGAMGAAAAASPLFVQVAALRSGDEIARSLPRLVPSRPAV